MRFIGVVFVCGLIGLGIFYLLSRLRFREPDPLTDEKSQPTKGKRK